MTAPTFGAAATPVPRSNGRPRIILPEYAPDAELAAVVAKYANQRTKAEKDHIDGRFDYYTRVSTMAKALDTGDGLAKWKAAMALMGAAKSPTIVKAAKLLTDWHDANELVEKCLTLAGAGDAATEGTTLHALTERIDTGQPIPDDLDDPTTTSLTAYRKATVGLRTISAETFVVCDELRAAGTFDRLLAVEAADYLPSWLHGRRVIGDLKTGGSVWPQSHAIQLAIYANSSYYDPADGTRRPLDVDKTLGLVVHMPQGEGRVVIWALDLVAAWQAAQCATWAKTWNSVATRERIATVVAEVSA